MAKINNEQALVPDNATIIENNAGTAPGLLFQKGEKFFFVIPGVPAEMASIMESYIIQFLQNKRDRIFKKRVIHTTGIPESTLFEKLGNIDELEKLAKIAFLPTYSGVNVRLTIQGPTEEFCQDRINRVEKVFQEKFYQYIWGYDDDTLENAVAKLIVSQKKTISIAEYGTSGNLSLQLNNTSLADEFFVQGFTFGSVFTLRKFLDLEENGSNNDQVVNEKICKKLSVKIRQITQSGITLSILHNEKLDVTTYVAISDEKQTISQRYVFTFHPSMNVQRITATALKLLYQHLN